MLAYCGLNAGPPRPTRLAMYAVKEIFYTLQGEGANAGSPAVFCRFAGCNLWSGREADRATAECRFCDTDFVGTDGDGGGRFASADELARACAEAAGKVTPGLLVVLTGGEPMLQVDAALIDALHGHGFRIAIETNGTLPVAAGVDWICVSPKAGTELQASKRRRIEARVPAGGPCARRRGGAQLSASLPAADGRGPARGKYRRCHRLLQGPSRLAPVAADPQADWDQVGQ